MSREAYERTTRAQKMGEGKTVLQLDVGIKNQKELVDSLRRDGEDLLVVQYMNSRRGLSKPF